MFCEKDRIVFSFSRNARRNFPQKADSKFVFFVAASPMSKFPAYERVVLKDRKFCTKLPFLRFSDLNQIRIEFPI